MKTLLVSVTLALGLLSFTPSASACEPTEDNATGAVACSPFNAVEQAVEDRQCYTGGAPECAAAAQRVLLEVYNPALYFVICPVTEVPLDEALDHCYI
jgi:hypothetical protein